jgi:hypothetical protein
MLLIPQRYYGIHFGRASRRKITGHEARCKKREQGAAEYGRIVGFDAV